MLTKRPAENGERVFLYRLASKLDVSLSSWMSSPSLGWRNSSATGMLFCAGVRRRVFFRALTAGPYFVSVRNVGPFSVSLPRYFL